MVTTKESKTKSEPGAEKEKAPVKGKAGKVGASAKVAAELEKPVIKKKLAKAIEIEKTQTKRLVKTSPMKLKKKRKVVKLVEPTVKVRNIGVEVEPPEKPCNDPLCPFHGTLSVRGQILMGVVVSAKMDKTAIVQREIRRYITKYERYEKRTHKYAVHNPPCLNVQRGDLVKIMECRPLSKSKSFVVIERT